MSFSIIKKPKKVKHSFLEDLCAVDGVYFLRSIVTDHLGLHPLSSKHQEYMLCLLKTLQDIHKYTIENDLLYSLSGGSLIGYYWNKSVIPWDDDIDIVLGETDYYRFKNKLLKDGTDLPGNTIQDGWSRDHKLVTLCGNVYILSLNNRTTCLDKVEPEPDLIKLMPVNRPKLPKFGGIDITMCLTSKNKKNQEGWNTLRTCCGPTNITKPDEVPIVTFSGVETRAMLRSIADPHLDSIYGPDWKIPVHPDIKRYFKHLK